MNNLELLHDPTSLERGDELIAIFDDCRQREWAFNAAAREAAGAAEETAKRVATTVHELVTDALPKTDMSDADYANFGRAVLGLHREVRPVDPALMSSNFYVTKKEVSYGPAEDLLNSYNDKPIAAERLKGEKGRPITKSDPRFWNLSVSPRRIGGFVVPNLGFWAPSLLVANKVGDKFERRYSVQVFSHYQEGPAVRIAIGE